MDQRSQEIAAAVARLLAQKDPPYIFENQEIHKIKAVIGDEFQSELGEMKSQIRELHDALMKPPSENELSFFAEMREVLRAYNSTSWVFKKLVWLIPGIFLIITAGTDLLQWLAKLFKGVLHV